MKRDYKSWQFWTKSSQNWSANANCLPGLQISTSALKKIKHNSIKKLSSKFCPNPLNSSTNKLAPLSWMFLKLIFQSMKIWSQRCSKTVLSFRSWKDNSPEKFFNTTLKLLVSLFSLAWAFRKKFSMIFSSFVLPSSKNAFWSKELLNDNSKTTHQPFKSTLKGSSLRSISWPWCNWKWKETKINLKKLWEVWLRP